MNIPPPNFKMNGTLNMDFAGGPSGVDPWSDYGVDETDTGFGDYGTGYGDPALQQAYQYKNFALQQLYSGNLSPQDQQALTAYLQELDQWISQHETMGGSNWDPLANGGTYQNGPTPDYQDQNQVVFENGMNLSYTVDKTDNREVHSFLLDNTIQIPSNAADVKASVEADSKMPGKKMAVITVTFADGTVRKIYVHNIDRENAHVNVLAASPEQVDMSAVVAPYTDKITAGELGTGGAASETLGDPPTKMEGGKRIYDGQSFNISPVPEGSNKETEVMASGDVTITPNSNSEWYTVEYDSTTKDYTVKVYKDEAKTQLKETIKIDGELVDHLYFAGDQSRVDWGTMAKTGKPHEIDSAKPGADKVAFGGESGSTGAAAGQPVNPDSPADSNVSRIEGDTAYYEDDADVDITNYFDGDIKTYDVTASGTVTLHALKQIDTFKVTYEAGPPPFYKIVANGKDKDGHAKEITYKVAADQVDKIVFDNVDASQVDDTDVPSDKKAKIQKAGESTEGIPANIQALFTALGIDSSDSTKVQDFLTKVEESYPALGSPATMEKLAEAYKNGTFPPSIPDNTLIDFLRAIDPKLDNLFNSLKGQSAGADGMSGAYTMIIQQAMKRLVADMTALYQGTGNTIVQMQTSGNWFQQNDILFNGVEMNILNEDDGNKYGETDVHF